MGEKGNAADAAQAAASGSGSLIGQAGSATANVVLETGETLRGKLVEHAADAAIDEGRERLPGRQDPNAGPPPPAPPQQR